MGKQWITHVVWDLILPCPVKAENLCILKDLLFGNNILHTQGKSILIQTLTNKYDLLHKMHFNIRAQPWQVLKD